MGFATKSIKYTLYVCNVLWAICGVLLLVFGALGWDSMPRNYAIGMISFGAVIFLISLFGCVGTVRELRRSLWTYAVFMLIILICIIVLICFNTRDVFKNYAIDEVNDVWRKEQNQTGAMDNLQKIYSCCGLNSAADYLKFRPTVPSSCCKDDNCIHPHNVYVVGCLKKVEEAFADEAITTKVYEWCLLGLSLLILILSSILAIHYTNQKRRYNY